jgi:hypothetical protein
MKNILNTYFDAQKELFDYFGYVEDWKVIPLDNQTGNYWMICGPENLNSTRVVWSQKSFTKELLEAGTEIYSGVIYTQRFLPKWVYRGKDYTMIAIDTQCDDNKMLMIFENEKECKDLTMTETYNENW